jgi:hypothetical protein
LLALKKGPKKGHPRETAPPGSAAVLGKIWAAAELAPFHSAQTDAAVPPNFPSAPRLFQRGLKDRNKNKASDGNEVHLAEPAPFDPLI